LVLAIVRACSVGFVAPLHRCINARYSPRSQVRGERRRSRTIYGSQRKIGAQSHTMERVGETTMKNVIKNKRLVLAVLPLLLTGCVVGGMQQAGPHLTPTECRDLAALRSNAPPTMAEHQSELAALRRAGYDPSPWSDDPYYPEDLQDAQRLVDYWFQTECPPYLQR
jgi:hypothetical protein